MNIVWQDLRYGARMLMKQPGFTLIAVLTLALGIGANTAIFSVVDAVLLRPLPYPQAERLALLWSTLPAQGIATSVSSMPDYRDWRERNQVFEELAGFYYGDFNLAGAGQEPELAQGALTTANFFATLKVAPLLGRSFTEDENQFGRHRVALLSYGLWQRRYGGDGAIVGHAIKLGGESFTVVGVMPQGMPFLDDLPPVELWTPIAFAPGDSMDTRNNHFVTLVGRLKPGVTIAQAQADVSAIARRMEEQYPENKGLGASVVSLQGQLVGNSQPALLALLVAVAFVLLVACVNLANLLLARAAAREKELAIRAALGATRARLVRQMLAECLPLAVLGGVLGALVALWGIEALSTFLPATLPRYNAISVNARILAFTVALSLVTVLLFGLLPAFQAARSAVGAALNESGRSASGSRRQSLLRRVLVISEVALALLLLVGAGLMVRSFVKLRQVDAGFTARDVLTMRVPLPESKYPFPLSATDLRPPAGLAFYEQLLARVSALPGVQAAAAGTVLPLGAGTGWGKFMHVEGHPVPPSLDQVPLVRFALISPDYFRAFGIALQEGRPFAAADQEHSHPVAIINETLQRRFFPHEDPIGKTITLGAPESLLDAEARRPENLPPRRVIVGVVADVKGGSLNQPTAPLVYAPLTQHRREGWSNALMLAVQTATAPASFTATVSAEVRALDAEQPVTQVKTVDELFSRLLSEARFNLLLSGLFAALALTLAAVGIYGVTAYAVEQRTHEIGIRMALGAPARHVLGMILKQGMTLALAGAGVGLLAALALMRLLKTLLFGVQASDPLTFAAVALLLVGVALLACWIPARRATKVDPMIALRCE
ncbi:MAG: ABC transporter permease [Blastocatellia bacterium]